MESRGRRNIDWFLSNLKEVWFGHSDNDDDTDDISNESHYHSQLQSKKAWDKLHVRAQVREQHHVSWNKSFFDLDLISAPRDVWVKRRDGREKEERGDYILLSFLHCTLSRIRADGSDDSDNALPLHCHHTYFMREPQLVCIKCFQDTPEQHSMVCRRRNFERIVL